ncbi:MAG: RNA methyltransferase [Bacillota bacterium]|nr:RNA methyltransferase [Bacillota bacterium]
MITSKDNQYLKLMKDLQKKKYRSEHGLFCAEGKRLVEGLLVAGLTPHLILYSERFQDIAFLEKACSKSDMAFMVADPLMKKICDTQNTQGVIAAFPQLCPESKDFYVGAPSLILVASGIQDPGNLGTIIRSAAAADVKGIFLEDGTVDLYNPKVIRATMGTVARVPIFGDMSVETIDETLRRCNAQVFMADMSGDIPYWELPMKQPCAVILGNEGNGPSGYWRGRCRKVYIPQANEVESLNVAMAGGIMAFDFRRRCLKSNI